MKLMTTDVDQAARVREPPPLEGRRHALIRGADQHENEDSNAGSGDHAARNRSHGRGSRLRFGETVFLDTRIELGARQAEQLRRARFVVPRLGERFDHE